MLMTFFCLFTFLFCPITLISYILKHIDDLFNLLLEVSILSILCCTA